MFKSIRSWLFKPYPLVTTTKQKLLMSLVFGKIVFLFFYFFKPYTISGFERNFIQDSLVLGLITFLISLVNFLITPLIFPKYFIPNKWVIGKMTLFFLVNTILVSIAIWYYNSSITKLIDDSIASFFYEVFLSSLIGFFILVFYVFLNERKNQKKHHSVAEKLSKIKHNKDAQNQDIIIIDSNTKENSFSLLTQDLVFINSKNQSVTIFYKSSGVIKKYQTNLSINELEQQLIDFNYIIRCHKSYIINRHHTTKIVGNARGYFLQLSGVKFLIPIAVNFPKEFLYTLVN